MTRQDFEIGHYDYQSKSMAVAEQQYISVGRGLFRVNVSVWTEDDYPCPFFVSFRYVESYGAVADIAILSGHIQGNEPAHIHGVEVEGPGHLVAYIIPVDPPSVMTFAAYIRRIKP